MYLQEKHGLCIILAYVPIYTYMALLGQQTPKIKTNLNEKKREKFGKQEELKKKNWWKDQVLLKENLILLFQNIILEKNIQASTSATVENSPDQIELSFEHER